MAERDQGCSVVLESYPCVGGDEGVNRGSQQLHDITAVGEARNALPKDTPRNTPPTEASGAPALTFRETRERVTIGNLSAGTLADLQDAIDRLRASTEVLAEYPCEEPNALASAFLSEVDLLVGMAVEVRRRARQSVDAAAERLMHKANEARARAAAGYPTDIEERACGSYTRAARGGGQ